MQRPARLALYGAPVIAVALVAGWLLWPGSGGNTGQPVTTKVTVGDVEDTVSAVGVLQPLDYVDVGTQVSGQVSAIERGRELRIW